MLNTQFGQVLRDLRKAAGKTLADVADVLGMSVVYLSDIERGNRPPLSRDRIEKVAAYFNVEPEQLVIAAAQQKGVFELDMTESSPAKVAAVSRMARGQISEEKWREVARILSND